MEIRINNKVLSIMLGKQDHKIELIENYENFYNTIPEWKSLLSEFWEVRNATRLDTVIDI